MGLISCRIPDNAKSKLEINIHKSRQLDQISTLKRHTVSKLSQMHERIK